jgi:hypothetical protein
MKKIIIMLGLVALPLWGQTPYQLSPDRYDNGMPPSVFSKEFVEDVCKLVLKDNYIIIEKVRKEKDSE